MAWRVGVFWVSRDAVQLPQEISEHLRRTVTMGGAGSGVRFDRGEFVMRVVQRDRADEPAAVYRARVVFEVFREATTGGVVDKVCEALPADVRELVDAGSIGPLN
ncbi:MULTISPECIES: DUF2267 domain-containing protein [Actinomycetes]|uniref:Uncharacterized conserved protein (DUF2267) n=2 Tax=Pseudonocardiaceae TaxID=2070 RepID=H5WYB9_9PSEU|nr:MULTISPECIES: DUF2267 domain-containing protein [Actinomycetes]EHR48453.1 Uncharacterized conserved protein (DUF2267) [Saccharomonospora marina XMU15]